MLQRLQKVLSQQGIASRRQAEQWIAEGRVQVNGETAHLGQKVDPQTDKIVVNGQSIQTQQPLEHLYILLNKPMGVVSTCTDPRGRPTVLDMLPRKLGQNTGLHPVGRLDQNSTGALLLTNHGDLTYKLTHPKHEISKTYWVWVRGAVSRATIQQWRKGVMLEGRMTFPAQVKILSPIPPFPMARSPYQKPMTCLEVVLTEGRNRQIRKVAEILGHKVIHLHRQKIGEINLNGLISANLKPAKKWRHLKKDEIYYLHKA